MKKTILIGTIITTAILIMMSFTSPVSARSKDSLKFVEKVKKQIEESTPIPGLIMALLALIILWFIPSIILEFLIDWLLRA